jgi:hypothetical protein
MRRSLLKPQSNIPVQVPDFDEWSAAYPEPNYDGILVSREVVKKNVR